MKLYIDKISIFDYVAPLVGAWIEIISQCCNVVEALVAPLVGAWIEISRMTDAAQQALVAPLVGAWIEIE